jgi:RTC4-like domain
VSGFKKPLQISEDKLEPSGPTFKHHLRSRNQPKESSDGSGAKLKKPKSLPPPTGDEVSRPEFQVPLAENLLNDENDGNSSPLSSVPAELDDDDDDDDLDPNVLVTQAPDAQPHCPMCGAELDHDAVDDFEMAYPDKTIGKKTDFRTQTVFCRWHKEREAKVKYQQAGYPDIDWNTLPARLKRYRRKMGEILQKPETSYFRRELDERVRSGKDRTLLMHMKNEGVANVSPGYYGARGLKVMADFILNEFSSTIRELAGSDKLIAARGPSGYVQMVLAPELATVLVMQDMEVGTERARQILIESSEIGDALNGGEAEEKDKKLRRDEVEDAGFEDVDEDV